LTLDTPVLFSFGLCPPDLQTGPIPIGVAVPPCQ
jgi:hypothetical protein